MNRQNGLQQVKDETDTTAVVEHNDEKTTTKTDLDRLEPSYKSYIHKFSPQLVIRAGIALALLLLYGAFGMAGLLNPGEQTQEMLDMILPPIAASLFIAIGYFFGSLQNSFSK